MNNNTSYDIFGDGMRIFLDYIARQTKTNSEYLPHPIIRAFEAALSNIDKIKVNETTMGVSHDKKGDYIHEPYAVVLKKVENGIEVQEIRNLQVDRSLPLDILIITFRIQIKLDKIEGDNISPKQLTEILNSVIPGNIFYYLGEEWKLARNKFKKLLEAEKIQLPFGSQLGKDIEKIDYRTPWEDYPNHLRQLIGTSICSIKNLPHGTVVITSPVDSEIEKHNAFFTAIETSIGKSSEYLQQKNVQKK